MKSKRIFKLFIIIIPLISLIAVSFLIESPINIENHDNLQIEIKAKIYNINGNNQLNASSSSGNGTYENPYIIEDLVITGGGPTDFPIYIENTDKYFILRNCTTTGGSQGITLDNVVNAKLMNNTASGSQYGIHVQYTNDSTVYNSTVHQISNIGVYLYGSNNINVSRNIIDDCGWSAIKCYTGKLHNISYNTLNDSGDAIYLDNSNNNSIFNNSIIGSNIGIYVRSSDNNTVIGSNSTDNSVGIQVDTSSINNEIKSNNASDNMWGILLDWANENTFLNNTANYNDYHGFYLTSSDFLNLTFNIANNNSEYGYYLKFSDNLTLLNNEAKFNNKTGIYIDGSDNGTYFDNDVNDNNETGYYLIYTDYSTFNNNTINNNSKGIWLDNSHNNEIEWNVLWYNLEAIKEETNCFFNTIQNNDIKQKDNIYAPNLTEGNVSPQDGTTSTVFSFTVNYTDADNNEPITIQVFIDGTPHQMNKVNSSDDVYNDSCIYYFNTTLSSGQHTYYFEADDGGFTVRLPAAGELDGPTVIDPSAPTPPIPGFTWFLSIFGLITLISLITLFKRLKMKEINYFP